MEFTTPYSSCDRDQRTVDRDVDLVANILYCDINAVHFGFDIVCDFQDLHNRRLEFLPRQFIQPAQRIFDIPLSYQSLEVFFWCPSATRNG